MPENNPFMSLETILDSKKLVEVVFSKAMKAMASGGAKGVSHTTLIRRLESKRVETCAKLFREKLDNIIKQFPNFDELNPFYFEMIELLIGKDELRKVLGSLQGTINQIWKIHREHKAKIWNSNPKDAKKERKAAFSRFSSMIMQLTNRMNILTDLAIKLKKLPSIDYNNPRIVVAGFPNVGKSSFLLNITRAKPEIANYPFTSKHISIGHYQGTENYKFLTCQVIDTPGLLDRPIFERNEIEKKAIAALKTLPSVIMYLIDPTRIDILNSQLNLLLELKSEFENIPIVNVINKVDLVDEELLQEVNNLIFSTLASAPYSMISVIDKSQSLDLMHKIISEYIFEKS
ncbi:MAG: NOG1 family protein [Candidatus Hodarchaeales archaeon]|jgi:nucleolar GTP-binding protein